MKTAASSLSVRRFLAASAKATREKRPWRTSGKRFPFRSVAEVSAFEVRSRRVDRSYRAPLTASGIGASGCSGFVRVRSCIA